MSAVRVSLRLIAAAVVACVVALGSASPVVAQVGSDLSLDTDTQLSQRISVPVVSKIELGGVERVDKTAVRGKLMVKVGQKLDAATVAADIQRLFETGLFDDVRVGLKTDPKKAGQVILRFELLERPSIAKVEALGADQLSLDSVMKVVDLRAGNLYSPSEAQQNTNKIRELYVEEGYFLATIKHRVETLPNNRVKVVFVIKERAEIKVRQIDILGNEGVSDADIKGVLKTQEGSALSFLGKGGTFKREQLEYDVQVIQYLYLTRGYIQAKVEDPEVSLSPDMRYVRISMRVHEGPKFNVGKISVKGDSVVPVKELLGKLKLKTKDVFNYQFVQQDGQLLAAAQKRHGFAFATVSNESVPRVKDREVDWVYHVQKGKKVYFGQIKMLGAATTRDKVIRRELMFTEGELYNEAKISVSKARVQRLGFFEKVDIQTRPTQQPQVVDVVVEVKERTTGTFQVGAGFSSVDQFITTAQISKDNFLGRGWRLSFQASLSAIRTMAQGSFFNPYFNDTNVTMAFSLSKFQTLYTDFTRDSTGGSISWGYRFLPTLMGDITTNIEYVATDIGGLSGRKDVPIASLFNAGLTTSLRATLTYDTRNDRWMPTGGWFLSGTAEFAYPALGLIGYTGRQNEFNRYTGRLRRYFGLPFEAVLKFNLVAGVITAPAGGQVPLFERFFMGGIFNVRGFQRNTLGPAIGVPTSGDPGAALSPFNIGGNKQLYLNNELEVPIVKAPVNLRGLLFFDVGNAFGEGQPISWSGMRMSFGWGVRWFSPVGPLRFEWGVPLNPQPGEEALVFAFTIGNSF
jgi:outer membrane protein insertion porin family